MWIYITAGLLALGQIAHALALYRISKQLDAVQWRVLCLEAKVDRRMPDPTGRNWRDSLHLTKYNWKKPGPF